MSKYVIIHLKNYGILTLIRKIKVKVRSKDWGVRIYSSYLVYLSSHRGIPRLYIEWSRANLTVQASWNVELIILTENIVAIAFPLYNRFINHKKYKREAGMREKKNSRKELIRRSQYQTEDHQEGFVCGQPVRKTGGRASLIPRKWKRKFIERKPVKGTDAEEFEEEATKRKRVKPG